VARVTALAADGLDDFLVVIGDRVAASEVAGFDGTVFGSVRQLPIVVIIAAERARRASMPRSIVRSSAVSALTVRVRSPVI
jgi:hypothetical protein